MGRRNAFAGWTLTVGLVLAVGACGDDTGSDDDTGEAGSASSDGGLGGSGSGMSYPPGGEGEDRAGASGASGTSGNPNTQGGNDNSPGGVGGDASLGGAAAQGGGDGGDSGLPASRVCRALGTDCFLDWDCPAYTYCADFKCVPAPAVGSPCVREHCEQGALCVSGQCKPPIIVPQGDVCDCPGCQCALGFVCDWEEGSQICKKSFALEGENCRATPCAQGLYCHEIYRVSPPTCRPLDVEGEACGETGDELFPQNTCEPGLYCDVACTPLVPSGEACSATDQCEEGLYCDASSKCNPSGLGTPCGNGKACLDGASTCSVGQCRTAAGVGERCNVQTCADGTHCNDPYECDNGHTCHLPLFTCVPERANGEGCDDAACQDTSRCFPVTPGATPDPDAGQLASATKLALGNYFSCAILKDKRVKCWGRNDYFQTGVVRRGDELAPVRPISLETGTVVDLSAGEAHACALLANGQLKCWGNGDAGKLGIEIYEDSPPSLPVTLDANVSAIAAGIDHTCALLLGGDVKCWGNANGLRLGISVAGGSLPHPGAAMSLMQSALAIAPGSGHTCVLLDDGKIVCGGSNYYGELGLGTQSSAALPEQPVPLGAKVTAVAASNFANYALLENGDVMAWGSNRYGVLGIGDEVTRYAPVGPLALGGKAIAVDASFTHACALLENGQIKCWGGNSNGQLGLGDLEPRLVPASVDQGEPATAIAVGFTHTCALFAEQTIKCWGSNLSGELGLRDKVNRGGTPETVPRLLDPIRL